MNHKFNGKSTKKAFEAAIVAEHGYDGLTASPFDELTDKGTLAKMTLYYKDGTHVGTWQTGSGWFAPAITLADNVAKFKSALGENDSLTYLAARAHGLFAPLRKARLRVALAQEGFSVEFDENNEAINVQRIALASV